MKQNVVPKKRKKSANNYVDNDKFYEEMKKYIAECEVAEASGDLRPVPNNYIGVCIKDIAEHLVMMPQFARYPQAIKDQMIGDGIENSFRYIDNFDPVKYKNPFGYFSMVIYWAVVRRVKEEKKELYAKYKTIQKMNVFNETSTQQKGDITTVYDDEIKQGEHAEDYMNEFIKKFEESEQRRKDKKKQKELEQERLAMEGSEDE